MNYELAKQLKDASFPQGDNYMTLDGSFVHIDNAPSSVHIPTLEELIDACGDTFKQLNFHLMERQSGYGICTTPDEGIVDMNKFGRWTARARLGKGHENHKKQWGKTPIEAVAKLWLELNKKI